MELKTRYQYSYFVYPYVVEKQKLNKYLYALLKDKHCRVKLFEKEKDFNIYSYFLPKVRDYMFWSFNLEKAKRREFLELDEELKAVILSKQPCSMFEYYLGNDVQGKVGEKNGIFFQIQTIDIICFQTGICFLVFKTNVENTNIMSDVLNFNYKFRDINSEFDSLKEYENIKIATDKFKDVKELSRLIKQITGPNLDAKELNIDTARFLTYTYTCVDQESWNEQKSFEEIEHEFFKYSNVLPARYNASIDKENINRQFHIWAKNKYAKCGFTKTGTALLASGVESTNYTILPFTFEREFLYTYLFMLYQKLYLKKINLDLGSKKGHKQARENFISFSQDVWIQEITNDSDGSSMIQIWKEILELNSCYLQVKVKYDLLYKEHNVLKTLNLSRWMFLFLVVAILVNLISVIVLLR